MDIKIKSNLAEDDERYVRYIDLNKERPGNWQYIDVDRLECDIREDEVKKWVGIRQRERARAKARKRATIEVNILNLIIRLIGFFMIFVGYSASLWLHEGGPVIALGLFGLIAVISPGINKNDNIETLYKKYYKEEKSKWDR